MTLAGVFFSAFLAAFFVNIGAAIGATRLFSSQIPVRIGFKINIMINSKNSTVR
jgi:hypothetical protein